MSPRKKLINYNVKLKMFPTRFKTAECSLTFTVNFLWYRAHTLLVYTMCFLIHSSMPKKKKCLREVKATMTNVVYKLLNAMIRRFKTMKICTSGIHHELSKAYNKRLSNFRHVASRRTQKLIGNRSGLFSSLLTVVV